MLTNRVNLTTEVILSVIWRDHRSRISWTSILHILSSINVVVLLWWFWSFSIFQRCFYVTQTHSEGVLPSVFIISSSTESGFRIKYEQSKFYWLRRHISRNKMGAITAGLGGPRNLCKSMFLWNNFPFYIIFCCPRFALLIFWSG